MAAGFREMSGLAAVRWRDLAVGGGLWGALALMALRMEVKARHHAGVRRREEELAAYAALDVRLTNDGDTARLARRVSRVVAEKSPFRRTAMMVKRKNGHAAVAASTGMDESTVERLNEWARETGPELGRLWWGGPEPELGTRAGVRVGTRSLAVLLDTRPGDIGYQRGIVVPLWTMGGSLLGMLAVGADSSMSVRRSVLAKALEPLEALAIKVERVLENGALAEKLIRVERLAGMGLLAGGMAHALNNPLTAVLGFAELIADTAGDGRVREDAQIIAREALKMQTMVETLLYALQPVEGSEERVDVVALVRERVGACARKLEELGVRMVVEAGGDGVMVLGNKGRLRQMLEHLLNNAAQALANDEIVESGEERVIRISVGRDAGRVHLLVSDSGPGFREPERVFTLRGGAPGMGLCVCYEIVHEHGGEISAFNLSPHGAAVAVELPV